MRSTICCLLILISFSLAEKIQDYLAKRKEILSVENDHFLGSDLDLDNPYEKLYNQQLMMHKQSELNWSFDSGVFAPSNDFYFVRKHIEASDVFKKIQQLPKGGVLHIHDFGITSSEWVVKNVTYRDNLYMCYDNQTSWTRFGWFAQPPSLTDTCHWMNVQSMRQMIGNEEMDSSIEKSISILTDNPDEYANVNQVWERFGKAYGALFSLLSYVPVTKDYLYHGFQEQLDDNVQYMEFRTVLPGLCREMGPCENPTSGIETAQILKEVAEKFLEDNPDDFCGIRMIYAPPRYVSISTLNQYLDTAFQLQESVGPFMAGFDLVGQEDKGRPLIYFVENILDKLAANPDKIMNLYFHAGETDWQGQSTDLNVLDALLLNATRIGHGYAIVKHPQAYKLGYEKNVPLEICPISNQVLKLVKDLRNHPASILIQNSFPLVISSDDPGLWGAKGLSYDFYEAFMAMASSSMDLRLLKKLAINSIEYTNMEQESKDKCMAMWMNKWQNSMKIMEEPDIDLVK